jgi:hypothetical protein
MTYLPARVNLYENPDFGQLMTRATDGEKQAIFDVIDAAYQKGQDEADARTAKLMTRIFSTFIGVTPGIDQLAPDGTPEGSRVRKMINIMRGH